MLQRELIRIGIAGIIGLALGVIMAVHYSAWHFVIIGPFFTIGLLYGGKMILGWCGRILGAWFVGLFLGGFVGFLVKTILFVIGLTVLVSVGWIFGCIMAVVAIYKAWGENAAFSDGITHMHPEYEQRDYANNTNDEGFYDWDTNLPQPKQPSGRTGGPANYSSGDDGFDF